MVNIWKCLAECIRTLHLSKTRFRKISPAEKKSLAIQDGALLSKLTKRRQKRSSSKDGNKWTRVETNKIRQYTNNREMCETMFSSQTRQNVHISTPLSPALFRENTTVVSRTAKMELFFSGSRGDPGLFVRLFLYVADSFFFFVSEGVFLRMS